MDRTIFGLRFQTNEAIQPGPRELGEFLESPKKEGGRELHGDDLARYRQMLTRVEDFEVSRRQGSTPRDFHEKMLYGVLEHSHFFKAALKTAVEQYKYHYHAMATLDLKKPTAFIRSAEDEINRLNTKRKDDAQKIGRLQGMIDERKKDIDALRARRAAIAGELSNIAVYIRDNLAAIQKLCEASIVTLVGLQIGRKKETQLIEDIKTHFKDQLRDYLHHGPVTKEYVESVKETVARLSKQISLLLLEDIYSMTGLYEALHDHVKRIAEQLDVFTAQIAGKKRTGLDEDKELFGRVEQTIVSLVSDFRFEVKTRGEALRDTEHDKILFEKRKEMLDHLFDLLKKGRR